MSRNLRRWALPLALALLVAFAGCSGGADDAASGQTMAGGGGVSGDGAGEAGDADLTASADDAETSADALRMQQRTLIRTGEVSIRVDDFDRSRRNLTEAVEARGGFVSDSRQQVRGSDNRTWTVGRVVLRVPKENFTDLLDRVKAEGEVRESSTATEDVTDQLVDLNARLENLRSQREQLRSLYESANDTATVLDVQERLSEVQTEIERLEAQRESLRERVAYSTVTVDMQESAPDRQAVQRQSWYDTGLVSAFVESVNGVGVVARGLAVGAAYAAPYLLAFGLPVGGAFVLWRRLS